jgi:hypothetical protein
MPLLLLQQHLLVLQNADFIPLQVLLLHGWLPWLLLLQLLHCLRPQPHWGPFMLKS